MPFLDARFPEHISYGATGGAGFVTDVVVVDSGTEYRNQRRALELNRWDVAHAARFESVARELVAFFRIAAGRANGFRFKDWTDYIVASGEGIFTSLGDDQFQMWKRYTFGAYTYDRKIQKPVNGTLTITETGGSIVDYATGICTNTTGTPTAWVGQFDFPARFDTDVMHLETKDRSGNELILGWASIPIVEIRV